MKVKICGVKNEHDLRAAVDAGVDSVGFLVGQIHASKDFILPSTAARLASMIPPYIQPTLVTHYTDPDEIFDFVMETGITNVQLHGGSTPEQVVAFRDMLPPCARITLAVNLNKEDDFVHLKDYLRYINAFLIDSSDPARGKVGGTGKTNNWTLNAKFVKLMPKPVILAGGLTPYNVADAIAKVRPYAVDANSGLKDASGSVNPKTAVDFVRIAHGFPSSAS